MPPSASTSSPILDTIDSNFKVQTQWMMTATNLMKWLQGQRCEAMATPGIFQAMRTDQVCRPLPFHCSCANQRFVFLKMGVMKKK
jgi:hypothetical protein